MNNKMGGDLKKIQTVGQYMVEVWKAVGMDMTRVQFLSSSEEINGRAGEYWCAFRCRRRMPLPTPRMRDATCRAPRRPLVLDIARKNNLARIVRCSQIMGRAETDDLAGPRRSCGPPPPPPSPPPLLRRPAAPVFCARAASQIFYPCMQCADIFFLQADICQLGMDQRKVNVLAREYCDTIKRKNKPVVLSHRAHHLRRCCRAPPPTRMHPGCTPQTC